VQRNITWTSSNTNIVTVDARGNITTRNPGTAAITAITPNGRLATYVVHSIIPVTSLRIAPPTDAQLASLLVNANGSNGTTLGLNVTFMPANATNTNFTWTSSNTNILTVNNNGVVTARRPGRATVTVTDSTGRRSHRMTLTVRQR